MAGGLHSQAGAMTGGLNGLFNSAAGSMQGASKSSGAGAGYGGPGAYQGYDLRGPDPHMTVKKIGEESNKLFVLAQQKEKAGKMTEAEKLYMQSAMYRERLWGDRDPAVIRIVFTLGQIAFKKGNYPAAEADFSRTLTAQLKTYGIGSFQLCTVLKWLGDTYFMENKFSDASNSYKQVYGLRQRQLGDNHNDTIAAAVMLAKADMGSDNLAEAKDLLKQVLDNKEQAGAGTSPTLLPVLDTYAAVLRKMNKTADADSAEARAREIRRLSQSDLPAASGGPVLNGVNHPVDGKPALSNVNPVNEKPALNSPSPGADTKSGTKQDNSRGSAGLAKDLSNTVVPAGSSLPATKPIEIAPAANSSTGETKSDRAK